MGYSGSNIALKAAGVLGTALWNQYRAGQRAAEATGSKRAFDTFSYSRDMAPPSIKRRSFMRKKRTKFVKFVRQPNHTGWIPMVRNTAQSNFTLASGVSTTYADNTLSGVYTTDLLTAYDQYRIRKVTAIIQPILEPASGLAANYVMVVGAACDCQGSATTIGTLTQVGQYQGYKTRYVRSGESFTYTYYPKVLNTVDSAGTATGVGSYGATNPWLLLTAAGIAIPHKRLLWRVESSSIGSGTQQYAIMFQVHFDVRRTR